MNLSPILLTSKKFKNYINKNDNLDYSLISGYFYALTVLPKKSSLDMKSKKILSECLKLSIKVDKTLKKNEYNNEDLKNFILENNKILISYLDVKIDFISIKQVFLQFKVNL